MREKCPELREVHAQPAPIDRDATAPPGDVNSDSPPADDTLDERSESLNLVVESRGSSLTQPSQSIPPSQQSQDVFLTDSQLDQPGHELFSPSPRNLEEGSDMDLENDPLKRASQEWTLVERRKKARPPE